jgi:hypothetical protein
VRRPAIKGPANHLAIYGFAIGAQRLFDVPRNPYRERHRLRECRRPPPSPVSHDLFHPWWPWRSPDRRALGGGGRGGRVSVSATVMRPVPELIVMPTLLSSFEVTSPHRIHKNVGRVTELSSSMRATFGVMASAAVLIEPMHPAAIAGAGLLSSAGRPSLRRKTRPTGHKTDRRWSECRSGPCGRS